MKFNFFGLFRPQTVDKPQITNNPWAQIITLFVQKCQPPPILEHFLCFQDRMKLLSRLDKELIGRKFMTTLSLHNTLARAKQLFVPLDPKNIRIYLCGPTVYDRAHLGNARNVIMFDVLFRVLRKLYGEAHVTYVRNFTDIDDNINAKASETGRSIAEITQETTAWYLQDMADLGNLDPTHMPRATAYVPQMIQMIENLINAEHAYAADGHVLFAVDSYADYGRLSGRTIDDMLAGARVEVAPYKRNPMDFVLWKPSSGDQPGWQSPWGFGRPGWHIECSAMSLDLLGESFDIHGGGNDLTFPHHENEIAQSCCAHPKSQFAQVWLHNEMLQVDGKKMSKSLGNFFTVRDLIEQGFAGEVIRFVFLSTHYGKPMDWTKERAQDAEKTLRKWRKLTAGVAAAKTVPACVLDPLCDDLNTAGAIAGLHSLLAQEDLSGLKAGAQMLGLLEPSMGAWAQAVDLSQFETLLEATRAQAMQDKDFAELDRLKLALQNAGVEVRMSKTGIELLAGPGFDPKRLDTLL